MEEIIRYVADIDFPTTWRTILPNIVNKLKSSDKFADIFGSLLALKNLVANYRFGYGQERQPLEILIPNTFHLLDVYAKNLLSNYSEQAAHAMQTILKTIYYGIEVI